MYFGKILEKLIKNSAKFFSEEINLSSDAGSLVNFYQTAWCYNPKDCIKISNRLENHEFHTI
jgi:hypothetical protein